MKKNIYIAAGKSAAHENLTCKNITVDGELHINGTLTADNIGGKGVIKASAIRAKTVRSGVLNAEMIVADIVMARQIYATEVRAKESVIASSFLAAGLVKSPKVTIADAEIEDIQTDAMIMISAKPHSILGALILSALRSLWLSLFGKTAVSAERERVTNVVAESVDAASSIENENDTDADCDVKSIAGPAETEKPTEAVKVVDDYKSAEQPMTLEMNEAIELLQDPKFRRLVAMRKMEKAYGGCWTLKRQGAVDITYEDMDNGSNVFAA